MAFFSSGIYLSVYTMHRVDLAIYILGAKEYFHNELIGYQKDSYVGNTSKPYT